MGLTVFETFVQDSSYVTLVKLSGFKDDTSVLGSEE